MKEIIPEENHNDGEDEENEDDEIDALRIHALEMSAMHEDQEAESAPLIDGFLETEDNDDDDDDANDDTDTAFPVHARRRGAFVRNCSIVVLVTLIVCGLFAPTAWRRGYIALPLFDKSTDYDSSSTQIQVLLNISNNTATPPYVFDDIWPKVQQQLCPNMIPNKARAEALISIARYQLGFHDGRTTKSPMKFMWTFGSGGSAFVSPNEETAIMYIRIYKAANNELSGWFKDVMEHQHGKFITTGYTKHNKLKDMKTFAFNMWEHDIQKEFGRLIRMIRRKFHWTLPQLQKKSCIVTAVRDPVSHFLAAYHEIEFRTTLHPKRALNPHLPQLYTQFPNGTHERFDQFVRNFVNEEFQGAANHMHHGFAHAASMVGILDQLAQFDLRLTDYLPSLTNLSTNWPQFLNATCDNYPQTESAFQPLANYDLKTKRQDDYGFYKAAKDVWKQQGPTARALCAINAVDYACYDKIPVPPLCQEVFSSHVFVQTMLQ